MVLLPEQEAHPFPGWHNKPLNLTIEEMENPSLVLKGFFETYDLPSIRLRLKRWLEDAVGAGSSHTAEHWHTCSQLERIVEAGWLLQHGELAPAKEAGPFPAKEEKDPGKAVQDRLKNNSDYRDLPFFDSVLLRTFCQVVLEKGDKEGLRLEGPEEILQRVKISLSETRLTIAAPGVSREKLGAVTVFLNYTELRFLSTEVGGIIRTEGAIRDAELHLVQNGTGEISLEIETGSLQTIIHGAGRVVISGKTFHSDIITYGSGEFIGADLLSRTTTMFLSGSGQVSANASKKLEGRIDGKGKVFLSGNPPLRSLFIGEHAEVIEV
jgi:hypothetical protein